MPINHTMTAWLLGALLAAQAVIVRPGLASADLGAAGNSSGPAAIGPACDATSAWPALRERRGTAAQPPAWLSWTGPAPSAPVAAGSADRSADRLAAFNVGLGGLVALHVQITV